MKLLGEITKLFDMTSEMDRQILFECTGFKEKEQGEIFWDNKDDFDVLKSNIKLTRDDRDERILAEKKP